MASRNPQHTIQRSPWAHRMVIQEIATRIRTAMEEQNIDLFSLAKKVGWAEARVLQWIDGSLAADGLTEEQDGNLRELVQIGQALGKRWEWHIGKAKMARSET